ncbi:host attachment family protein [Rhizorhapis sp. SPR117]|uniref:host attachment family protein n=1 Tax=Rhizorhapis sp. SPR117 TaxID=2912611 RepID=UPI001F3CE789|nr:host attachment family protein [Rhizorhapis sp. SPR117]
MKLARDTRVVVLDGDKALFFCNGGLADRPKLELEREIVQENPPDREQGSDQPGRAFSSVGAHRSAFEETDFHQLEQDRFAAQIAELLKKMALANEYDRLIVVAPPRTLGMLRKHYHKEVEGRLIGEIGKDLTGHPVPEIEKIILQS